MKYCTVYELVPGDMFWYDESDMREKRDRLLIYRNEHVYGFLTRNPCGPNMILKEFSMSGMFFDRNHHFIVDY